VDDPARKADRARELVVQMDREVVAGGIGVADGLIQCEPVRDLRERWLAVGLECVLRSPLADGHRCLDASEELGDVLLVQGLAVLVPRDHVDHERRPARASEQRDRRGLHHGRRSGLERPAEKEVLLVVHDAGSHLVGGDRTGREDDCLGRRHGREDRPARNVVGCVRVRLQGRFRHRIAMLVRRTAQCLEVEAHSVIPVAWPPLTVNTWPCTKFDQGEQRKKIAPAASSGVPARPRGMIVAASSRI